MQSYKIRNDFLNTVSPHLQFNASLMQAIKIKIVSLSLLSSPVTFYIQESV